ncbi:MAG: FAD-dependent oxidoreductase [Acidobacteria bacterium]|nr:FAD-dependent oxidoreductase [Acidobacteriota bacterium]
MSSENEQNGIKTQSIPITINRKKLQVPPGETILNAAKGAEIDIPTLCHNSALSPYGACRICLVEIIEGGKPGLVAACHYKAREGLVIETDTPAVRKTRRMMMELLLARNPESQTLKDLAKQLEVSESRIRRNEHDDCILCGLCVRMCRERMGQNVLSFAFRGDKRTVSPAFDRTSPVCIGCGACEFICPTNAIFPKDICQKPLVPILSDFEAGLGKRPVVNILYPQAVPNVPTIDKERCLHLTSDACGICETVCQAEAISFNQKAEMRELDVGAVILCPGFEVFDAAIRSEYGFGIYDNVVTSRQFERILSASGPSQGEIIRPSDGKQPKKIAFISCVGSRDQTCGNLYCSSVCCMYSTKEALIAKEHQSDIEPTIFYMDMRAFGKGFERYFEGARDRHGIRYERCLASRVMERQRTKNLLIRYRNEAGRFLEEEFDLVVLAVGITPSPQAKSMAKMFGVELNAHGFCRKVSFSPTETTAPGIFVSGAFGDPKDIPETVIEASAAAAQASELLASKRGTLTTEKTYPDENPFMVEEPRVGVFVCRCGRNIGGVVDVPAVVEYVRDLPHVVFADESLYTCSQDALEKIKSDIQTHNLTRVVVASCTPTTHASLFRDTIREAGLNPYLFEMASIREHVSWVHMNQPQEATKKAKHVVTMAVSKASLLQPIRINSFDINKDGLVLGAGLAGMTSALSLAEQGFNVHLVEKTENLGGHLAHIRFAIDGKDPGEYLNSLVKGVEENERITVYSGTDVKEVSGYLGNYKSLLKKSDEENDIEIRHGIIILATGAKEYQPREYLYGQNNMVMTQTELEESLSRDGGAGLRDVVMIQCVGSRDEEHSYCSRICCSQAVKNALKIKELNPEANVTVLYRDIRTYGTKEEYYLKARKSGVLFVRYEPENKPVVTETGGRLQVEVRDLVLGKNVRFAPDCVVLSTGIYGDNEHLSQLLKLPLTEDGFFMEAHAKIRPLDFTAEGVFLAGLAHSPRTMEEAVAQAKGAAIRAVTILSKDRILAKAEIPVVNAKWCSGCGNCIAACPYDARKINPETETADVIEVLCQACGACSVACHSGVSEQKGFEKRKIMAQIDSALTE